MIADYSADPLLGAFDGFRGSIVDLEQGLVVDHAELGRARRDLAELLRRRGLRGGDRVLLAVGNGPRFFSTLGAVLLAGGSPLPVHVDTPPAELKRSATRWAARFVLTDGFDVPAVQAAGLRAETLCANSWERLTWATIDRGDAEFRDLYPSLPGVPLHPTSGTTAQPKLAVRPAAAALAEAQRYVQAMNITAADRLLAVTPMTHAYAFGQCVVASLISHATVVAVRRFQPKLVARAVSQQRITILPLVPAMLDLLLLATKDWSHVPRFVLTAGAPLSERTANNFHRATGRYVQSLYGSTETGLISLARPDCPPGSNGCVGPALPGVAVKLLDASADANLPPGVGKIAIRSTSMMAGYLCLDRIDSSPLVDGWFTPGDLAQVDEQGQIHLKGREAEVINVFGMKVIPSEVEDALALMPSVIEAKVYAGRHPSGSQIVKAAIVAAADLTTSQVRAHCEHHLAPFKRPEVITLLDRLPRSPAGKIVREQLP
jgi:acyl-coenzyme A synthetase/AMP-(fatty) acid ligase